MPNSVLIVEDEALIALALAELVEDLGYVVLGPAFDGREARAIAALTPPDLALVDLNLLDGGTGQELAAALVREHGTQVAIVSANMPMAAAGGLETIAKPYRDAAIAETLRRLALRRAETVARAAAANAGLAGADDPG